MFQKDIVPERYHSFTNIDIVSAIKTQFEITME